MNTNKPQTNLKEGVDYYVEKGLFVFAASYHLRRGYCCQSSCRHCPYGFRKVEKEDLFDENPPKSNR